MWQEWGQRIEEIFERTVSYLLLGVLPVFLAAYIAQDSSVLLGTIVGSMMFFVCLFFTILFFD